MALTILSEGDRFRTSATGRLDSLRSFMQQIRGAVDGHRKADKERLDEQFPYVLENTFCDHEKIDAGTAALFHYSKHLREFTGDVPRLLNYSLVQQIYTALEEIGLDLCEEIYKRDSTLPLTVNDSQFRSGLAAIQLYLEKICKVHFSKWSELNAFRKLRNSIIHSGGMVAGDDTKQKQFLNSISPIRGVHIFHGGRLYVPNSVVDHFLTVVEELFQTAFIQRNFGNVGFDAAKSGFDGAIIVDESGPIPRVQIVGPEDTDLTDWEQNI